ncbi:MAG: hypothetical protein AB7O97_16595 [Planctomycetota bacterium]
MAPAAVLRAQQQPPPGPGAETGAESAGESGGDAWRDQLVRRLRHLDLPFTDWVLLRDVGDKVATLGQKAQPAVAFEVEFARDSADPRYRIRLLGVQARIDTDAAVKQLEQVVVGDDEALAALAARVLGRVGAPTGRIAELLKDRLARETRLSVRGALILAAGEAGATESAPLLQVMIEKGAVEGQELLWTWTALAQTAGRELAVASDVWLVPESQFVGAAVLMARRWGLRTERELLELLARSPAEPLRSWVLQTLAAVGGDDTRKALRQAVDADGAAPTVVVETGLDPRRLALLRLGDKDARRWAIDQVVRAATRPEAEVRRLPELFGRWNVDGAAELLLEWAADPARSLLLRASAARGLCWMRDPRGLRAAAAVLQADAVDAHEPMELAGLQLAQQTLHQFVADAERPDYLGLLPGDREKAGERGLRWRAWLDAREAALQWRRPTPESADLWRWY